MHLRTVLLETSTARMQPLNLVKTNMRKRCISPMNGWGTRKSLGDNFLVVNCWLMVNFGIFKTQLYMSVLKVRWSSHFVLQDRDILSA